MAVCAATGCAAGTQRAEVTSPSVSAPVSYAAQVVRATNAARDAEGLAALRSSACAEAAARERAAGLVGQAPLAHRPLAGVIARCAPAATAAENLSRAAASPSAVVDAWLGSPGHRSNLLDPELTDVGVGCVEDDAAMLCSQVFLGPDQ